jgi:hypothetical protein
MLKHIETCLEEALNEVLINLSLWPQQVDRLLEDVV